MTQSLLSDKQLREWLQVCRTLQSLKELTRQGSLAAGFNRGDADSIAAHTGLVGFMALTLSLELKLSDGAELVPERIAAMAILTNLSSAILGDINSEVKRHYFPEHQSFERLAFEDLIRGLESSPELLLLFDESQTHQTVASKIVRFAEGLDAWFEVTPRSSIAWMQQHEDYRNRVLEQLKGDRIYGDALADMFLHMCVLLGKHLIPPKRPAVPSPAWEIQDACQDLANFPLDHQHIIEWLQVCQTTQRLKRLVRQGFITSGGFNRWDTDSIADHMGLVTLISFTLASELRVCEGLHVDPYHVVALALVHDLGEAILGDINSEGKRRYFVDYDKSERLAVQDLLGQLRGSEHLMELFDEFNACETTESKIVRFADSLDAWQRVTAKSSDTWMPQHIEYRQRTFYKLKGDKNCGDSLAELFLQACMVIQGEKVGPKRPTNYPDNTGTVDSILQQLTSEIVQHAQIIRTRQQELAEQLGRNIEPAKRDALRRREETLRQEMTHTMQTLMDLKERLLQGEAENGLSEK